MADNRVPASDQPSPGQLPHLFLEASLGELFINLRWLNNCGPIVHSTANMYDERYDVLTSELSCGKHPMDNSKYSAAEVASPSSGGNVTVTSSTPEELPLYGGWCRAVSGGVAGQRHPGFSGRELD